DGLRLSSFRVDALGRVDLEIIQALELLTRRGVGLLDTQTDPVTAPDQKKADVARTDDRRFRLIIVKQCRALLQLVVDTSFTALDKLDRDLAVFTHANRTEMCRQPRHDNGVVGGAADGVVTRLQPRQADQCQPAVRCSEALETSVTPAFDVGVEGCGGMRHGESCMERNAPIYRSDTCFV